ncbi:MAG: hypothetical protein P4L26_11715 [Terracidiphilus sp.]|nr:hypothetical protein [Terracidiphilus sp.]
MLEMIFNFLPEWLALYKTPMSSGTRQWWGKARKLGCAPFVIVATFCLGGFTTVLDFGWSALIEHQAIGGFGLTFHLVWWFSGALVVATVEWFLNESRFRLPSKPAPSDRLSRSDCI